MNRLLLGYFASYGYIFSLLVVVSLLVRYWGISRENARKAVHIGLFPTWFFLYFFLRSSIHSVVVPVTFVVVNSIVYCFNRYSGNWKLPVFIRMLEREENPTPGTVYYALSISIMAAICFFIPSLYTAYGIGVIAMSVGDGMASVIGQRCTGFAAKNHFFHKTFGGSAACAVLVMLGSCLVMRVTGMRTNWLACGIIGVAASILEIPGCGLDNLTVPLGTMAIAVIQLSL